MASRVYNQGILKILNGSIDYLTDTVNALIVNQAYTFDKAHDFVDDVVSNEVANSTGTGYERKTLSNKSVTLDNTNNRVVFDADNLSYTAVSTTQQLGGLVIYKEGASDGARALIAFIDFNDLPTNGSDINVNFDVNGVFRITNILS